MKQNAVEGKVKLQDLVAQPQMELTAVEKVTFGIVLEKVTYLQTELQKAQLALSGLITQAVQGRGLDVKKFGVNLGVGKILPVDIPKAPGGDGTQSE